MNLARADMLQNTRTSDILLRGGFSLDYSYYLFSANYADKWIIASLLGYLFDHDDKAYVIAANSDMEILRIFLGERMNRVIPADENSVLQIQHACQADPNSYMPPAGSGTSIRPSPQRGCIRSLHIVNYPYFAELSACQYARYLDMQRMIMFIPGTTKMSMPLFVNSADEEHAQRVLSDAGLLNCKSAIVNPVNFTNRSLSFEGFCAVSELLHLCGYKVAFNVAQSSDPDMAKNLHERTGASILSLPGHLMKTIFDNITLCIGAAGGALAIADAFSTCNVFSITTQSNVSLAADAPRKLIDTLEFEIFKAEPRPKKAHFYKASSFLPGSQADEIALIEIELKDFLNYIENSRGDS